MQLKLSSSKKKTNLDLTLNNKIGINLQSATPIAGSTNYEKLKNLPKINGRTITGDLTSTDLRIVSENTVDGWSQTPLYVPKAGEIVIYTDYSSYENENGTLINIPNIKIGDGQTPLIDLPFVDQAFIHDIQTALDEHINNTQTHVSPEDRTRWDAKLNYIINGETLMFNRT